MNDKHVLKRRLLQIIIALFIVGSTITIALNRDKLSIERFRAMGYMGVFLLAWIGSSTVLLPIPHLAFTFTMGAVLNPWVIGFSGGVGDALGELTGYIAGYAVEEEVENLKLYKYLKAWMEHNGDLTIFVLSLFPVPFFDLAAMAGGIVGYPLWRFMIATWAGKTIKAIVAAWAGYFGIAWVANLLGLE